MAVGPSQTAPSVKPEQHRRATRIAQKAKQAATPILRPDPLLANVDKALAKPKADTAAPTAGATMQTLTESSVVVSSAKPPAALKPAAPAVLQPSVPMGPAVAFPNATSSKLIVQGRGLFREGQVVKARERFMAAIVELAPGRVPEVLPDLARTYDPYYLQQLAKPDVKPNPAMALAIYRRAALSGSKAYEADIQRLEQQRN